ncbi:hypothetical protein [Sphaerothrix gracilis]|uniref:hypothetical protein n=1 Tax=Sphaerothrix gracilis TaxID=3151835 RepID=UPI0031FBF61F
MEKKSTKQIQIYAEDLELMHQLVPEESEAEIVRSLLEQFLKKRAVGGEESHQLTKAFNWFIDRIEQLETELDAAQLQLNRIHALSSNSGNQSNKPIDRVLERDHSDSTANVEEIVEAIIDWNDEQKNSEQKIRISFPSVKSLALLLGAGSQPVIREVMKAKSAEIKTAHREHGLTSRHNRRVSNKDSILQAIARDKLKLPNWEEAQYTN